MNDRYNFPKQFKCMYCKIDLDPIGTLSLPSGKFIDLKCLKCKAIWRFWVSTQLFHKLLDGGAFNKKQEIGRFKAKDFDGWNKLKKYVNTKPDNFGVHEREIWWTSLGVNVGVEIDGKHKVFERPALIIRKFNRQMVWVLPTTSVNKDERFYEKFLFNGTEYFAVLTQLRTVSTKRLVRKVGMMPKSDFERVVERVRGFLKINGNPLLHGFPRRPKP